jgi:hypothetical protein
MDLVMLSVTGAALALAVAMTLVAVRLMRGERDRSAARVAALASSLDDTESDDLTIAPMPDADDEFVSEPEDVYEALSFREPAYAPPPRRAANAGPMFAATDEPKAPGRRWLALGAVAMLMAVIGSGGYLLLRPATLSATGEPAVPESESGTATVSRVNQLKPIELLSLKHTVDNGTFSLVGLVVNPLDGARLPAVSAVVYLFDKDGTYFASGKAPLEFRALGPGEESPFTVHIPNVKSIGRYRVGFRREDGSVIAHLDKRGQRAGSMTEGGQ